MSDDVGIRKVAVTATVRGSASGVALVLDEPLSFWGGLQAETGLIIDQHHPQRGECVAGRVLVMDGGRGSSSASSVLAEAVRLGTAPAAFVLRRSDEIIALGCLVAEELYGLVTPVVVCGEDIVSGDIVSGDIVAGDIVSGDIVSIDAETLTIAR